MAEQAMVTAEGGATNSVLRKLTRLLANSGSFPLEVRLKIVNLKEDLEILHAFLLSLSEKQGQEERVRSWMVEAREVSYHIEDILDRKVPNIQICIEQSMQSLADVESRRPITTSRIEELFMSPYWGFLFDLEYSPSDSTSTAAAAQGPSEHSTADLFGVDELSDSLASLLKKADDQSGGKLKVLSIVGCRGLGKKTLAKEVHKKLKKDFDCAAFVEVAPNSGIDVILNSILSEVSRQKVDKEARNHPQLVSKLCKFLQDKRYLITVGDIHSASSWKIIKEALPDNRSSRIITTTCINSIANTCCPQIDDIVFEMNPLTSDDSNSLLLSRVSDPNVVQDNKDILNVSGYTPLAIISLASILTKKESTGKSWEEVRNSLSIAPGNFQELEESIKIFSHSYYDLPHNLKACALYLSMLPVNHKIDRDWLVRKWIAEGFVHEEIELGLEDVAISYLDVLVDRNFIQPVCSHSLLVERYQVHFMMLCLLKMISWQEKFVTLLHTPDVQKTHNKMNRRLSLYYPKPNVLSFEAVKVDVSHVRSINVFGGAEKIAFQEFSDVQLLDLEGCTGVDDKNMKDICCMLMLTYLSLKNTQVSQFPPEIQNLQHLQTLDVRKTKVQKLPNEAVLLKKLVNLLVGDSDIHQGLELPEGIKDLTLLKVLGTIDLRKHTSNILLELSELTELRELEVVLSYAGPTDKKQNDDKLFFLRKCSNLQSLVIFSDFSWSMDMDLASHHLLQKLRVSRSFVNVPLWIAKLVYLVQLEIRVCKLEEGDLGILRKLPCLQRLILGLEILPEEKPICISNIGFVSLDKFCFDCKMPWLTFQKGAMPKLKHLELKFYGGLLSTQVPSGTKHLTALQKVVLRYPKGCEGSASIKQAIDALKREADEHVNYITMHRYGIQSGGEFSTEISSNKRVSKRGEKIEWIPMRTS